MEYTPNQLDEFKHEFAVRRKRQLMVAISFVLVIIAFALLARFETDGEMGGVSLGFFFPIFFAVVIGALAFSFRNWRCPACGRYLGRELSPRFCSKCGVALQ
ncbi:MAG TPA: hypothetical protein VFQ05_07935 [Candidatus Eisenbacteria bacterium]|nr:hypothetical protein [Candidatus Eisenbacteria bacterium]